MSYDRKEREADYAYEVWRRGGDPDNIDHDDVPEDWDWVYDDVSPHRRRNDEQ